MNIPLEQIRGGMTVVVAGSLADPELEALAQAVGADGQVHMFEASRERCEGLRARCDAGLVRRFFLQHGRLQHRPAAAAGTESAQAASDQGTTTSLDAYAAKHLRSLDWLVMATGGWDGSVLLGGWETIRRYRPALWLRLGDAAARRGGFCVYYIVRWLQSHGYSPAAPEGKPALDFNAIVKAAEAEPARSQEVVFVPSPHLKPTGRLERAEPPSESALTRNLAVGEEGGGGAALGPSPMDMKSLRYVYAHTLYHKRIKPYYETRLASLRSLGYDVEDFVVTLNAPGPLLSWPELDRRWVARDRELMRHYGRLRALLDTADVLVNFSGANLHPEFVQSLPTFNVFTFHDDPDHSEYSRHLAAGYDYAFVANISCLDLYQGWGLKKVSYMPLGVLDCERDTTLTEEKVLTGNREVPLVFLGSRDPHRDLWLQPLLERYPKTALHGDGWGTGYISAQDQIRLYGRSRLGWNIDQSTGPVSSRIYKLPANGVMLLSNNAAYLGGLYRPGVEAVGWDTVAECIELTEYYLHHEEERRRIAAAGWRRAVTDYSDKAVWQRMLKTIETEVRRLAKRDYSPPRPRRAPPTLWGQLRKLIQPV